MLKNRNAKTLIFPVFIKSSHGGMQQVIYSRVQGLKEKGWSIIVVVQKTTDLLDLYVKLNVKIIRLNYDIPSFNLKNIFQLFLCLVDIYRNLFRYNRKSIIVTNDLGSHLLLFLYPFWKDEVYISRGGLYKRAYDRSGALKGRSTYVCKISFRRLNHFIAVSDSQKEALICNAKVKPKYVSVIYDSYDSLEKIAPKEISSKNLINLSVVGYIDRNKNQKTLLYTLKNLRNKGLDCYLNIYGSVKDQSYYSELLLLIKELDIRRYVLFHGFIDNKVKIFSNTHVLISSSWSEGFGLTLIQAMSYNVPTIAYSGAGGPLSIIDDNISGILVKNNMAEDYELSILKYINNEDFRNKIVDNGFQKYERCFSLGTMIDKYDKYFISMK